MPSLSILCVSKAEDCCLPLLADMIQCASALDVEIVIAGDGPEAYRKLDRHFTQLRTVIFRCVQSGGYIESVLDYAVSLTSGDYILRVDDDESISPGMLKWLAKRLYESSPHWMFPRLNLWQDVNHYISTPPLYPDYQTRLSAREKSGGRYALHCGSPYGGGVLAPASLHHHKFLIKSREERQAIADRYERLQTGAGVDFMCFSVPEVLGDKLTIKPISEAGEGS